MITLKKSLVATLFLFLSFSLFNCSSTAESKKNAENEVKEANKILERANKEYLEDVENYRSEKKLSIAHNDSLIMFHKEVMQETGMTQNPFYKSEIDNLEKKNRILNKKIDNYKGEEKDNWTIFKEEFDHDMKELGKSLKDLTVKNTK